MTGTYFYVRGAEETTVKTICSFLTGMGNMLAYIAAVQSKLCLKLFIII